jgi:UDP-2,3-diacylglucosamine hydrolase
MSGSVADAEHGPIAIVCGGGSFPGAVAEAIKRRGREPVMFALKGWADPAIIARYRHHWIPIGQAGRFLRLAKAEQCRDMLFIGSLQRIPVNQIRLDWLTIRMIPRVAAGFRGGDDKLLSAVASVAEYGGMRVIGLHEVAPEVFLPAGVLGRHRPGERDEGDIAVGMKLIATLGPFDVGQAAVVADNHVLAVEAAEGTDNMLARIAELRAQRRLATPPGVGVLVKAAKPGQDRRFDLPSIGPRTIENAARAGLAGVAVAAGSTIVTDAAAVIALADREKIFIAGVGEDGTA